MSDFDDIMGLPEGIPEQLEAETTSYYKVPAGIYIAVFGRLNPKYKDMNNKGCNADYPGATFSHCSIPLWLVETHGTSDKPIKQNILGMDLKIPTDRRVSELYYPLYVSWNPEDQWKNVQAFGSLELPNDKSSKIITPTPGKPQIKTVNFKALTKYYGIPVRFGILWSAKDSPYIDKNFPLSIVGDRIAPEKMKLFEEAINAKVEKERAERQSSGKEYTPPSDDIEGSNDLDSFLNV